MPIRYSIDGINRRLLDGERREQHDLVDPVAEFLRAGHEGVHLRECTSAMWPPGKFTMAAVRFSSA